MTGPGPGPGAGAQRQVLDHVALVVPSLAAGRDLYARLGFALTPQSSHKGPLEPGWPVVLWGAGNHCAMFRRGYFEILGVTDPDRHHSHVTSRLDRYSGLHLVALGCDDAGAMAALLAARGVAMEPVVQVGRDVPCGGTTRPGLFHILRPAEGTFPEADLFYIHHATPEVLWQPALLDQPNGVTGLSAVTLCSDEPAATLARLESITGRAAIADGWCDRLQLDAGCIEVATPARFFARYPQGAVPVRPSAVSAAFTVASLGATAAWLAQVRVPFAESPGEILVAPAEAGGALLRFMEDPGEAGAG